jgi:hypothetical protein
MEWAPIWRLLTPLSAPFVNQEFNQNPGLSRAPNLFWIHMTPFSKKGKKGKEEWRNPGFEPGASRTLFRVNPTS